MELRESLYTYQFDAARIDKLADGSLVLWVAIAAILVTLVAYYVAPYLYGYCIVQKKEVEKQKKLRTLSDLRTMNEIQTELETEMRDALIAASWNNTTSARS
jgi:H+/gluconate symporter-like permease